MIFFQIFLPVWKWQNFGIVWWFLDILKENILIKNNLLSKF